MRKFTTALVIVLHFALAYVLYAAATEPTKPLPPEDTLIRKADFPAQNAQAQIWQTRADLLISGKPYTFYGTAETDPYGGVTLLESPTGNAVTIFADGSSDVYVGGVLYRFEAE